jgi:hypothetical protein
MATKQQRRISRADQAEELRLLRAAGDDSWWGRPDAQTVEAVWKIIEPTLPASLRNLTPDLTARQVLTTALGRFVQVGEEPEKKARRGKRRTITRNHVFDAVAPQWSRTFRQIANDGRPGYVPTRNVSDQDRHSAEEARRQLLAVGVRLADIWKLIVTSGWSKKKGGENPLFYLTRPNPKLGYRVTLRDTRALAEFQSLIGATPAPSRRLLLDSDPWPSRVVRRQVCAEHPYNQVVLNDKVTELLDAMERTRLVFDVGAFEEDYSCWKRIAAKIVHWKKRVPHERRQPFLRRVRIARKLRTSLDAYRQVHNQVRDRKLSGVVQIKSRFFRDREGRFHAAHFWPQPISGRLDRTHRVAGSVFWTSQRARWFRFPAPAWPELVGYDVSSSQTQILAILLGLDDLEELTRDPKFKMKVYLAEEALSRLPMRTHPRSAAELVPMMKDIWTRILYGGKAKEIVWDHFERLVPGTFTRKQYLTTVRDAKRRSASRRAVAEARKYNAAIQTAEHNLEAFLEDIPWYGKPGEGKLSDFFRACERLAQAAMKRDVYAGVTFTDPLSGVPIRWNPVRRARKRMNCQGFQVGLRLPGGWQGRTDAKGRKRHSFLDAIPHPVTGDYRVNSAKLKSSIAPGVIHLLDSCFNALVVQQMTQAVPLVAVHDCWYVPGILDGTKAEATTGLASLVVSLRLAGREWLQHLGPVYEGLVDYLAGTEYEAFARRIQAQWQQRVAEARWPRFKVEPTELEKWPGYTSGTPIR